MNALKGGQYGTGRAIEFMLMALVTAGVPRAVTAQEPSATIALVAVQFEVDRLAPGETAGEAIFMIDEADGITIEIIAIEGLTTSIEGPAGEVLDENTIDAFNGEFASFEGAEQGEGLFILPTSSPGFHHLFTFPSLGPGTYTVRFEADPDLAEEVPVITQLLMDSPVGTSLFATESTVTLGNPAVLTAALFEGDGPVLGATIEVVIRPEVGPPVTLTLLDDGGDADDAPEDGLYSAEFVPDSPGLYRAAAAIDGFAAAGFPFFRESGTQFTVVVSRSTLTGGVEDRGVDDDGNTLFDRVVVDVETNTTEAGDYRLFVHLKTQGGQTLVRSAGAELPVGVETVGVDFEAMAFHELGEDGPYTIELVELVFLGDEGATPSDRLINVGETQPYLRADFEGFVENGQPPVARCQNVTISADTSCQADVSVDADSFDPDDDEITLAQDPAGPYSLGDTDVTLIVMDDSGETDSCTATVTVVDDTPPAIVLEGAPRVTLECGVGTFTDPGVTGTDNCDQVNVRVGGDSVDTSTRGTYLVTYDATDASGNNAAQVIRTVTVADTLPPSIRSPAASPNRLWPPNHKIVPVAVAVSVADLCDAATVCQITSVSSNEPIDGLGHGDTAPDWEITGNLTVNLRAERSGSGSGRVYTITVRCTDASGNSAIQAVSVTVPHDQGKGKKK